MKKLVLIRHGESIWNKLNKFTGWTDVELSEEGIMENRKAGQILKENGYTFDVGFTSYLKRGIQTLWNVLEEMDLMWIPEYKSWRLNEKHYGSLQGLNKVETAEQYGEEQVLLWRRSYDQPPPPLSKKDERYPGNEEKYKELSSKQIPLTECLKDTVVRVVPYWKDTIAPMIKSGKRVLIAAHGNSLRALIKYLDNISDENIIDLDIPTGIPLVYELDDNLKPLTHYYLGDQEEIEKSIKSVKDQGKVQK